MFSGQYTEEAFLLSSLYEVVKVWARGSGQAKFDLSICDGKADLSLNFKLGHPEDQHCDPPNPTLQPDHYHQDSQYEDHDGQEPFRPVPQPRHKSQARRERNRVRAARHRAAAAAATAVVPTEAASSTADVILPFTGTILPMQTIKEAPPAAHRTADRAAHTSTASPTPAAATAAISRDVRPVKTSASKPTIFDVQHVKKKLFSIPSNHQVPPSIPDAGKQKCYKMREDDLWTKLFL
jgi:hypothetical protein